MSDSSHEKQIESEPSVLFENAIEPKKESSYEGSNPEELDFKCPLTEVRQELKSLRGLTTRSMIHFLETMDRITRENEEMKQQLAALDLSTRSNDGNSLIIHQVSPDSSFSSSSSSPTRARGSRNGSPGRRSRHHIDRRSSRRDRSRSPRPSRREHRQPRQDHQAFVNPAFLNYVEPPFSYVDTSYHPYNAPYDTNPGNCWGYWGYESQIDARGYPYY